MTTLYDRRDVVTFALGTRESRALGVKPGSVVEARVLDVVLNPNRKPGLGRVSYRLGVLVGGNIVGDTVVAHSNIIAKV